MHDLFFNSRGCPGETQHQFSVATEGFHQQLSCNRLAKDGSLGQHKLAPTNTPFGCTVQWMAVDFLSSPLPVLTSLDKGNYHNLTFFFPPSQPLDFPKKNVGMFFWTHLAASTPHPPTHRPTSPLPTLACSFCHLPSHLHISNNQVSSPPTCLPTHLRTKWNSYTYLPTHLPYTPTKVLHTTQGQGNVNETRCKYCNPHGTIKWQNLMKVLHFR